SEPMNAPMSTPRPASYRFHQGERVLPFAAEDYEARLRGLRALMAEAGVDVAVLTSMHGIAYYSGFLYCSFGRPYGLVVTSEQIRAGAAVADVGGYAIRDAVKAGAREIDVAMAGRDAMELEIARRFPDAEYRDTWVWFQSGINTDGAHNPVTARQLQVGDIL